VFIVFVVACALALGGPLLVHTLLFASLKDAGRFFERGNLLAFQIALVYIVAVFVIAVLGALYSRGRRVPPLLLHLVALSPFAWAIVGCIARDRDRLRKLDALGYGRYSVSDFARNVASTEVVLDVAATMSAFAMLLVLLAGIIRHASRRDAAGVLMVAPASSGVLAAVAIHAYGRYALFHELHDGAWGDDAFAGMPHAALVTRVTMVVAIALTIIAAAVGVVTARRLRGRGGAQSLAFVVVSALLLGVPPVIAGRDDARFHVTNPSVPPDGVQVPASTFVDDEAPNNMPRVVVKRDGQTFVDTRDGNRAPISDSAVDHDPLGLVVDRDTTFATLKGALAGAKTAPFWLMFYVRPPAHPEGASFGALPAFILETHTAAQMRIVDRSTCVECVFITLGDPLIRIWRFKGTEVVAPSGTDPPAIAARRAVLTSISADLMALSIVVRVRGTDTIGRIWTIADDIHASSGWSRQLTFTDQERAEPEPVFSGNVW